MPHHVLKNAVGTVAACDNLFPKTVDDVKTLAADAKTQAEEALKAIYAVNDAERSFQNTARASDVAQTNFGIAQCVLAVTKDTNVDKEVREAAAAAVVELEAFGIDSFSSNKALFSAFKTLTAAPDRLSSLSTQRKYWLDEAMKDFKRKGLELPSDQFERAKALQKEISELSTAFEQRIADDKSKITATLAELDGVPEGILAGLDKEGEGDSAIYTLKMDYPTYFGVMRNCTVAKTRQAMGNAFENRGHPENLETLHTVIKKRHELATALGYPSYAALDLENKMAKAPEKALDFIKKLVVGLKVKWEKEKALLISREPHDSVVIHKDADGDSMNSYDIAFAMNRYKNKFLNVDETKIQEYFPMDKTVDGLFSIYERFFGIKFEKIQEKGLMWHESLQTLAVHHKGKLLGYIVLDLFPREGKFTHACCHGIVPPVTKHAEEGGAAEDGFTPAVAVVIANFPQATADRPALFLHDDVETFFHEFGHAIHYLFGKSEMATVAGFNVKMDFVELPSQMLEEWMWEASILKMISSHYKTGEPLSDELIESKIASKSAFSGRDGLRQMTFATFALGLFDDKFPLSEGGCDSTALQTAINKSVLPGIKHNESGHFQCSFGHLMGYGAAYYGYMWSEVFAQDVFDYIRERDGLLSETLGNRYIDCIIGCGGGRDPNDSLKMFLEREPNAKAFLKKIGIEGVEL